MDNKNWSDISIFKGYTKLTASLNKYNNLFISKSLCTQQGISTNNKNYIQLYFSKINNAIIFKFTDMTKTSHTLAENNSISITNFLNKYAIDINKVIGKYIVHIENIGGLQSSCIIYLDDKLI